MFDHSLEIFDGSYPLDFAGWDSACIGHGDVRPLRRPPNFVIASEEICLPWQGHDLGEAAWIDLAEIGVIKAEGARIDILISQIEACLDAGKEVVANAAVERGAIELLRDRILPLLPSRSLRKFPFAHLIEIVAHKLRHVEHG